jgi:hypothetical protein
VERRRVLCGRGAASGLCGGARERGGLQDAALAELARVLRSGGVLVGTDGLDTPERRRKHIGDIFVPVDPGTFPERLRRAGFADARVEVGADRWRFAATSAS